MEKSSTMFSHKSEKISSIQVLIIEDDAAFRDSLQTLINGCPDLACPFACESCEEALDLLNDAFLPQVILLDIKLPGMSGIAGIRKLKTLSPVSHIIMLTVFDDDDTVFNAICEGAIGYLLKSATSEQITAAILEVMSGGAAISPRIATKILKMFTQYSQPKQEYGLTRREKEILQLLVNGLSKKHVADQLHISLLTLDTHLKNIYAKLHVHSQIDVIAKTLKEHLI
jgi:DNA-binding NarL/FixJ family response regulator